MLCEIVLCIVCFTVIIETCINTVSCVCVLQKCMKYSNAVCIFMLILSGVMPVATAVTASDLDVKAYPPCSSSSSSKLLGGTLT